MAFIWGATPVGVRSTGMGLIYDGAVALFGGLASVAITRLISVAGDKISPVYYVVLSAAVGVVGLLLLREHRANPVIASAPIGPA